jgi:enamine deaminase RidA (YjgF/YER057c/UK114 family)
MRPAPLWICLIAMYSVLQAASGSCQENKVVPGKKSQAPQKQPFRIFDPDNMAKPTAGYSQVAEVTEGKIVYIAGQVALDRAGNLVGKDDFRAQVQQVFENLKAAVEAAGGDFTNIIKLNYYCAENVDPSQIPAVREIRDKYVNTANPPVSTFVVVKRLVRPEWLIEVEAVAVVKK